MFKLNAACAAVGMLALAACSPGAGSSAPASGQAAAPSATAPDASAPVSAGPVDMPRPRVGQWRMAMTVAPGVPPIGRDVCLTAEDVANANAFAGARQDGGDCDATQLRRDGDAIVGSTTCRINGRATTSHIRLTGDTQSRYQMEMTSDGPGAQTMRVDATYLGPCPA